MSMTFDDYAADEREYDLEIEHLCPACGREYTCSIFGVGAPEREQERHYDEHPYETECAACAEEKGD
ncbi:MAG TPA: hypothetical protein VNF29_15565 [Candidatus Binataceae bacterium]|nr:hypothetical protein [Candidatus Binataceae bacterium]